MARTQSFEINGTAFNMPATYKASKAIAEKVGDPLRMAMDSAAGRLSWSQENVIDVLHIGLTHGGCSLKRDDIAEHVMEIGLVAAMGAAAEYIALLVQGGPERPVGGGDSKKAPPGST